MAYLTNPLPLDVYDEVLTNIVEVIFPCVRQPLVLADFLTDSYNLGGHISLLALEGLFFLMHNHNLDYPKFYSKIYNLINPVMLHAQVTDSVDKKNSD